MDDTREYLRNLINRLHDGTATERDVASGRIFVQTVIGVMKAGKVKFTFPLRLRLTSICLAAEVTLFNNRN